jgi:hypothetical protein
LPLAVKQRATARLPFIINNLMHKKMKVKQLLLSLTALVLVSWFLSSCGDKKLCCVLGPNEDLSKGIFVVNEGPWGGSGTVLWHNPETGETIDSLFEKANDGAVLGQFVQSLAVFKDKTYIVVNGTNRVVVVDAGTFRYLDTIGGLALPRFILPIDDFTALVSQWGTDGLTGSVAKVNLVTRKVTRTIPTGKGPEKMIRVGNKVYVANSGGYGSDSSITEIDLGTDESKTIPIPSGLNPATLAYDNVTPKLFYLCKGYYLDPSPAGNLNFLTNSAPGFTVPAYADDLQRDATTGALYFIGGGTLYKAVVNGNSFDVSALAQQPAYGLGFDPVKGLLYCADAKDFISSGEVVVYTTTGVKVGAFRAGVAPGEVIVVD